MRLLSYLNIQIRQYLLRMRWLLPLPVMLFITYRSVNAIRSLLDLHSGTAANIWDVFFITFGNGWNIVLIISNLFLFLVSDLLPEPGFGQLALLRLGSRRTWWLAKCLVLAVSVVAYTLLVTGIVVVFASFVFPVEFTWSTLAITTPESLNIPLFTPRHSSTMLIMGQTSLLLMLGWFSLGLLIMVVTQWSHQFLVGYLVALVALMASFAVNWISDPAGWIKLFFYKHLMFNHFPLPFRDIPVPISILYWVIWILCLGGLGFFLSQRQDYFANRH